MISCTVRKTFLILVLPLLLLFTQQMAAVHEIGHFSDEIAKSKTGEKQTPANKFCDQCFGFSSIAGAVTSEPPTLALADLSYDFAFSLQSAVIAADAPAYRNRGPPVLL